MIRPNLKYNLLSSIIVVNVGLIFTIFLIESNEFSATGYTDLKTWLAYGITLIGIIYFAYYLNKILKESKTITANSESSDPPIF